MSALTSSQLFGVEVATRASSVASILGSLFIIGTYLCLPYFRRPTTRLIFYATWGNIITNVATLVSVSAVPHGPREAQPLCQIQAFLIQWFMLADPFWVFCMAWNVGRIFRSKRYDGSKLPDHEKWYGMIAYGVPAITATIYLIHDQISSHHILGPAILWCWVRQEFDWMRIAFFYAPMWILAAATMSIHIWVGSKVYKVKMEMHRILKESEQRLAPEASGTLEDPFVDRKDTIRVTTDISHDAHGMESWSRAATPSSDVNWLTCSPGPRSAPTRPVRAETTRSSTPSSPTTPSRHGLLVPLNPNSPHRHHNPLLIGKYRATAYAAPLASGDFATLPSPRVPIFRPTEHAAHVKRRKGTTEAFRYFKSALLLFIALVVVWVPSSLNRLYQLARPDDPSYALNLISALVLPTQGLWNAVIYAQASWKECKRLYVALRSKLRGQSPDGSVRDASRGYKESIASEGTELSSVDRPEPNSSKLTV